MFRYEGSAIKNEHGKILSVQGAIDGESRHIQCTETDQQKPHQQWEVVYADEWKGEPTKGEMNEKYGMIVERPFYIVSALAAGRYLDVINNRNMVIKTPNGRSTQVWYFDQRTLTIKTKLNNQSWDIKSAGKTSNL